MKKQQQVQQVDRTTNRTVQKQNQNR